MRRKGISRKYLKRKKAEKLKFKLKVLIIGVFIIFLIAHSLSSVTKKHHVTLSSNLIKEGLLTDKGQTIPQNTLLCRLMIQQLGKPYLYGGNGPDSFDCSGLTKFLYEKIGFSLPRVVVDQAKMGVQVDRNDLRFGDIIFFSDDGIKLTHVGIYTGNGYFLHAPKTGDVVKLSKLSSEYYSKAYKKAVRILPN